MIARSSGIAVAVLIVACGCGKAIKVYRLKGPVTCAGKPVVAGEIVFLPFGEKANAGPSGIATIVDGRFDTAGSRKPGVAGGSMAVSVHGSLDRGGKRIVQHEFMIDLPQSDHEFAIEIPEAGATDAGPEI